MLVALQHHERLDGSGYPYGCDRQTIHPISRLAAVADTFDAMTANRAYRKGMPARQAILELHSSRGNQLDSESVAALIKLIGVYPVGTRVVLAGGEQGTVVAPNPLDTTRPYVLVYHDRNGRPFRQPFTVSLQYSKSSIIGTEPPR